MRILAFKTIAVAEIAVKERLRPMDDEQAKMLAFSIEQDGLINPITVRRTPNANHGETPYTLVTGGRRLRAFELLGRMEIEAMVVEVAGDEADELEVSENLFRDELSVIDRALFVKRFRELWEAKHGKIRSGRPPKKSSQVGTIIEGGFSEYVKNRLGLSKMAENRLLTIAENLREELRVLLRSTEWADNGSMLLKLAKRPADDQLKIAAALREGAELETILGWFVEVPPAEAEERAKREREERIVKEFLEVPVDQRQAILKRLEDMANVTDGNVTDGNPIKSGPMAGLLPILAERLIKEGYGDDKELVGLCRKLVGMEQVNTACLPGTTFFEKPLGFKEEVKFLANMMIEYKIKQADQSPFSGNA